MKAIVYHKFGSPDVLEMEEVEKPVPKDNEVLIKVRGASANAYDLHYLKADPFLIRFMDAGLLRPKNEILGVDVAGQVEAVGSNVKQFKPGDNVFGDISGCGCGGFAEYACACEDVLVLKPDTITFEEAAAFPMASVTALKALRDIGDIQTGQRVLINGASGGVGTFAVQIARSFEADVTAVCSTGKMDTVRSLGADHAIDYTQEDFTQSGEQYDLILAANGHQSILEYKNALSPGGTCVVTGGSMNQIFQAMLLGPMVSMTGSRKIYAMTSTPDKECLEFMKELIEAGKIKPVIDRNYQFTEIPEALRYLDEGHALGKVVITI